MKIAKKLNLKILYKKNLGTGPFLASYSLVHNILKKIYPVNLLILTLSIILDFLLSLFSQKLKNYYPISNFVVFKKINYFLKCNKKTFFKVCKYFNFWYFRFTFNSIFKIIGVSLMICLF